MIPVMIWLRCPDDLVSNELGVRADLVVLPPVGSQLEIPSEGIRTLDSGLLPADPRCCVLADVKAISFSLDGIPGTYYKEGLEEHPVLVPQGPRYIHIIAHVAPDIWATLVPAVIEPEQKIVTCVDPSDPAALDRMGAMVLLLLRQILYGWEEPARNPEMEQELYAQLRSSISRLKMMQRTALILRYGLDGEFSLRSYARMGKMIDKSAPSVKYHLQTALQRLRRLAWFAFHDVIKRYE